MFSILEKQNKELRREETMHVFVETLRKDSITLEMGRADTIKKAKRLIKEKLVREEIAIDDFDLVFAGKILEKDKFLWYYKITENSKVHMAVRFTRESEILVRYQDNNKEKEWFMVVEIGESDKRLDLKLRLQDMTGVSSNLQRLLFHGNELEEGGLIVDLMGWTLTKNSVDKSDVNNRTIIMLLRSKGGGDLPVDRGRTEKKQPDEVELNKCVCAIL